jgi:hypothetical protein
MDEWKIVRSTTPEERAAFDDKIVAILNIHARTFGLLSETSIVEEFWERLDPSARGNFLAGLSTDLEEENAARERIESRLADAELTPETTCELGVNAALRGWPAVLDFVLLRGDALNSDVPRIEPFGNPSRWEEYTKPLSNRVVDLILEAALRRRASDAVIKALQAGANPNLSIWCLERSYNKQYSALAYAIKEEATEIAEALLDAGALPCGTAFGGFHQPLFMAVLHELDALAERLLDAGASFSEAGDGEVSDAFDTLERWFSHERSRADSFRDQLPLVDIQAKRLFHTGGGQGGFWYTWLTAISHGEQGADRLRLYHSRGLSLSLSVEELCWMIQFGHQDSLAYILEQQNPKVTAATLAEILGKRIPFR